MELHRRSLDDRLPLFQYIIRTSDTVRKIRLTLEADAHTATVCCSSSADWTSDRCMNIHCTATTSQSSSTETFDLAVAPPRTFCRSMLKTCLRCSWPHVSSAHSDSPAAAEKNNHSEIFIHISLYDWQTAYYFRKLYFFRLRHGTLDVESK